MRPLKEPSCPCQASGNMAVWDRSLLLVISLWMCFGRAAAFTEPYVCYVLDGILFLYGIILTALYWVDSHATDTYETIGQKK
ncbi:hypothetical protein F7725_004319 [Dissostichus mawsoni]|uniref:Uncharacterized protein n=1 Tax=Dissostichus mawsoni TaxID=36200 RepID=A0A7J5XID7_DISMA|nr:hypothetical protein F7725_004319 [Dissostichus mawsoni]